ncbi:DUF397 domain-containing protein [Nonomuraea dietziae]|uniref:DUF397 domain-containing protein n=1 Tax=Nonomuraea dietziae TaxID=65515 RepID=A0A7W5VCX5_9ACTN|nr:DUF397 domain-containing protein [Nonomuraea dietziae]MBB3729160.1 hypothetical protein [Nonomuraea dietziae]
MESTTSDEIVWRKSSFSNISGECVEVAWTDGGVLVRDSKQPEGHVLSFTRAEWAAFLARVRHGEFDAPEGDMLAQR